MGQGSNAIVGEFVGATESWKRKHQKVQECWELEDTLRDGLRLYRFVRDADEAWSKAIQKGCAKFDEARVRGLRKFYESWYEPCDDVLRAIEQMERTLQVDGAPEFRDARLRVQGILRAPIDAYIKSFQQMLNSAA